MNWSVNHVLTDGLLLLQWEREWLHVPGGGGDTSPLSWGGGGVSTASKEGAQIKEGQTTSCQGVSTHVLKVKVVLWLENVYKKKISKITCCLSLLSAFKDRWQKKQF